MEKTVLEAQTAKARARTHNALTIKASETDIEGDVSTIAAFRESIEEDLCNLKF